MFIMAVATSIDAFSAGISLALYDINIIKPAILFTTITFINSTIGFNLGEKLSKLPRKNLEISAGIVLILLGIFALF